jgi:aspartate-semialdehyde dehydrogenase
VISEYGGEARLIQPPQLDDLRSSDIVFLCESGKVVSDFVAMSGDDVSIVDMVEARPRGRDAKLVHMDVNPTAVERHAGGLLAVPHELTTLIVDILAPLERVFGCEEVVSFILRPAADFGEAGVNELRDQTVRLLSFADTTAEVFGRQLAFNVIPQSEIPAADPARRVVDETGALLGWDACRMTLSLSIAPVFFGHTLRIRLRASGPCSREGILDTLAASGVTPAPNEARNAPLDVSTEKGLFVFDVRDDGLGGFWLSAVAGEVRARTAELAVRLAHAVRGL